MRQEHRAGDKVFVDYSGKKLGITDPTTGEVRFAEIFVAVLGASSFTYCEASWSQTLPDWIGAHVRMFRFFGGVPRLVVPDGPNTEGLVTAILASRPHPEQGFRTCLGVLRLFRELDKTRAEAVSARAVAYGAFTYKSIASIIANKLDRAAITTSEAQAVMTHGNLRGSKYFH
jgi:transposase